MHQQQAALDDGATMTALMNHLASLKRFAIKDSRTDEVIYRGVGHCAQEVYEAWRRHDLRPIEYPQPGDLESDDAEVRLKALILLNDNEDSWIEDDEIVMQWEGNL